jgi:hypothetical protein
MAINKIDALYKRSLIIVERDMAHLNALVIGAKLSADNAMDLARYVKLLKEMKLAQEEAAQAKQARQSKATKALANEALEAAVKTNS